MLQLSTRPETKGVVESVKDFSEVQTGQTDEHTGLSLSKLPIQLPYLLVK